MKNITDAPDGKDCADRQVPTNITRFRFFSAIPHFHLHNFIITCLRSLPESQLNLKSKLTAKRQIKADRPPQTSTILKK